MKKLIAIVSIAIIVFCYIPAMHGIAASYPDAIQNGSFEEKGTWNGKNYSYAEEGYDGGSIRLSTPEDTDNCYVGQRFMVMPMTRYRLSAFIKAEVEETNVLRGPAFKVESYSVSTDSLVTPLGGGASNFFSRNTNGAWEAVSYEFETPRSCNCIGILLRLYGGQGTVYFDEVKIEKVETYHFSLQTDAAFYYNDMGSVTAEILWNDGCFPEKTGTVDYVLSDKNGKARKSWSKKSLEESFSFPLSELETEGEVYTLSAKLRQGGIAVETRGTRIYRYERPSVLDKNGVYYKDGKPFYPRIGYHVSKEQYESLDKIGVNVVQLWVSATVTQAEMDSELKLLKEHGLMALIALYYKQVMPGYSDLGMTRATRVINRVNASEYKDAVFGFALMDEPFGLFYAPDAWLETSYKLVRDLAPDKLAYVVDNKTHSLNRTVRYVDALAVDPYPGASEESTAAYKTHVTERVKMAKAAAWSGKAVYNLLQAFDYKFFTPTADDIKHMEYQGLYAGATGSGLCALDTPLLETALQEKNELYKALCAFAENEIPVIERLLAENQNAGEPQEGNGYRYRIWKGDKRQYVLFLNTSGAPNQADIPISADYITNELPFGALHVCTGAIEAHTGVLSVDAAAGEVRFYEIYDNKRENGFYTLQEAVSDLPDMPFWFYYHHAGKAVSGRCTIGIYKTTANGRELVDVKIGPVQNFETNHYYRSEEINVQNKDGIEVKSFVWEGDNMFPVLQATNIKEG